MTDQGSEARDSDGSADLTRDEKERLKRQIRAWVQYRFFRVCDKGLAPGVMERFDLFLEHTVYHAVDAGKVKKLSAVDKPYLRDHIKEIALLVCRASSGDISPEVFFREVDRYVRDHKDHMTRLLERVNERRKRTDGAESGVLELRAIYCDGYPEE